MFRELPSCPVPRAGSASVVAGYSRLTHNYSDLYTMGGLFVENLGLLSTFFS